MKSAEVKNMPFESVWDFLFDTNRQPERVWLTRLEETDDWKPLRKADCKALNEALETGKEFVYIDGGRATADIKNQVVRYNFINRRPTQALTSGTWFRRVQQAPVPNYEKDAEANIHHVVQFGNKNENNNNNNKIPYARVEPLSDQDAAQVEQMFQKLAGRLDTALQLFDDLLKKSVQQKQKQQQQQQKKQQQKQDKQQQQQQQQQMSLDPYTLSDNHHLGLCKHPKTGRWRIQKQPPRQQNLFGFDTSGPNIDLQRGYFPYTVQGEAEEMALGPVDHVIFVVHGIGEALWSRQDFTAMKSFQQELDQTRRTIQERQLDRWKRQVEQAKKQGQPEPPVPNRIEVLPIEWWDRIHSSTSPLVRSLGSCTLPTIPGFRSIANDVVLDVMLYLTPGFCERVLDCVVSQIQDLHRGFRMVHPDFGGQCSIVGHSLGSVIVWDILSLLKKGQETRNENNNSSASPPPPPYAITKTISAPATMHREVSGSGQQQQQNTEGEDESSTSMFVAGPWGPNVGKDFMTKKAAIIPFVPNFTIFLGSPIGMFLSLRGAHAVFHDLLQEDIKKARAKAAGGSNALTVSTARELSKVDAGVEMVLAKNDSDDEYEPVTSPFTLPSGRIYNIFHPSDPVGYRIEPLLLSTDVEPSKIPPPQYLGRNLRFHVQAKRFGDDIRRSFQMQTASIGNFFSQLGDKKKKTEETSSRQLLPPLKQGPIEFALGGTNQRIDFQLQPGVIENEYLSAVSAHSSYFANTDVLDLFIDLAEGMDTPYRS